ncbi:polysaccharide biosynthesis/export family protein [Flavobacterium restrictum]|nr:polysaccharide biosynthesis/export family protein [Flavobacterium restrictum]
MKNNTLKTSIIPKTMISKKNILFKIGILLFLALAFFSCASRKDIVYYQNIDGTASKEKTNSYEVTIQPDDLLMIIVSTEDPEIAIPFNLKTVSVVSPGKQDLVRGAESNQLYLVDSAGFIDFPVIGKLKIGGMTRTEVLQMLQDRITVYIKNPVINLRIMNFKVSVQGEVVFPGTYPVNSERITLIEALAMAKDLTIYGVRKNILIIREVNGIKSYNRVDITKADFINSPYYYLTQNDVIYVEPNKNRINGAAIGTNAGIIISVTSLLITLITLIVK